VYRKRARISKITTAFPEIDTTQEKSMNRVGMRKKKEKLHNLGENKKLNSF